MLAIIISIFGWNIKNVTTQTGALLKNRIIFKHIHYNVIIWCHSNTILLILPTQNPSHHFL